MSPWLEILEDPQTSKPSNLEMPVVFGCFSFLKLDHLSQKASMVFDIGAIQIIRIPREPRGPPKNANMDLVEAMSDLHEKKDPLTGYRDYPKDLPLSFPNDDEELFEGIQEGQCFCCYYRRRQILNKTESGMALMTPGWYWDSTPVQGGPRLSFSMRSSCFVRVGFDSHLFFV